MRTNLYRHSSQQPMLHQVHRGLEHLPEAMPEYRKLSRNAQPVLGISEPPAVDSRVHLRQCLVPLASIPAFPHKYLDHVRPLSRHLSRHRSRRRRREDHPQCQPSSTEGAEVFKVRWTVHSRIPRRHQMANFMDCRHTPRIQIYCTHLYWEVGWTRT